MLLEEDEHSLIEDVYILERRLLRALTLVMKDLDRQVPIMVSPLEQSVRQVDILAIHEKILIEQPHLVDGRTAQHAVSATHHLDLSRFVPRQITHVITSEPPALGEMLAQSGHLVERGHGGRQTTSRLKGPRAISLHHAHP